jgi:hypothetical protein
VAYTVGSGGGSRTVAPTWLERDFLFPDWRTNSNFTVVNPIAVTGQAFGGLDAVAASTIANPDLRVDMSYRMVDTVTGMKLGVSPASAAAGKSLNSNRYVLQQTYTLTNTSGSTIQDLQLFQFLHSLNGVTSLYDNRSYGGPKPDYRYNTTQIAVDESYVGTGGPKLQDYIGFAAKQAPAAFDSGWYGINNGSSDHVTGKPATGVHLAVENDALAGLDNFSPTTPANQWVAGAQKYLLSNLAQGQSLSFDVLLGIKTGTMVQTTGACDGSANGGSQVPGGIDFSFDRVLTPGSFFCEYSAADPEELSERIAHGEFTAPGFWSPGAMQLYELEYDGEHDGDIILTFGYDPSLLPSGFDENQLDVYHFVGGEWQALHGTVNALSHTIQATTETLSPFAVGAVPEPSTFALLLGAAGCLAIFRRRARAQAK